MFCLSWIFYLLDLLIAFWTILSVVKCFLNILSAGDLVYIYIYLFIYLFIYLYLLSLGAYKSQLGGASILSLLFSTVNVYCDYIYICISI